jgi:hypothetical protein
MKTVYVELIKNNRGQIVDAAPILLGKVVRGVKDGVERGYVQIINGHAVQYFDDSEIRVFHV